MITISRDLQGARIGIYYVSKGRCWIVIQQEQVNHHDCMREMLRP
jgi:hypothetical protein